MMPNIVCSAAALALALSIVPAATQDKEQPKDKPAAQEKAAEETAPDKTAKPEKPAEVPAVHPFVRLAGSWSGGGTLTTSGGSRERLRCRANYAVGHGERSLSLSIRCAGDSYRFELSSNVVDRRGRIYGRWSEASYGVSGSVAGTASGDNIRATAHSDSFTAGLSLTTHGNRQSVSISPRGAFITGVHIAMTRR